MYCQICMAKWMWMEKLPWHLPLLPFQFGLYYEHWICKRGVCFLARFVGCEFVQFQVGIRASFHFNVKIIDSIMLISLFLSPLLSPLSLLFFFLCKSVVIRADRLPQLLLSHYHLFGYVRSGSFQGWLDEIRVHSWRVLLASIHE